MGAVHPLRGLTLILPVLFLATLALPCCARRHRRLRGGLSARRPVTWYGTPTEGPVRDVDATRLLRGALRVEGGRTASAPWPASALVAVARIEGGAWLFASEDGTVYRAPSFLGPLSVQGALEGSARALSDAERTVPVSHGALWVVDREGRAWVVEARGTARRLALTQVRCGMFVSEREVLAVVEPGVLQVSHDGGRHFTRVELPGGEALSLGRAGDRVFLRSTEGVFLWDGGVLVPDSGGLASVPRPLADGWAPGSAPAVVEPGCFLPVQPGMAVAASDGTIAALRDGAVVVLDPRTREERVRIPAPGEGCTLARAGDGVRAVCRHGGWARAVFALREGAWVILRDELRDEPVGSVAFDAGSRRWVVAAPCAQRSVADPRLLCLYDDTGVATEHRAPFAVHPLGMGGGMALLADAEALSGEATEAVVVREGVLVRQVLPFSPASARTLVFDGAEVRVWELDSRADRTRALVHGVWQGERFVWRRQPVPAGAVRGVFSEGRAFVVGSDASVLFVSEGGGAFRPLPSPVRGDARRVTLDLQGPFGCAGPWCCFGRTLALSMLHPGEAPWLTRPVTSARR